MVGRSKSACLCTIVVAAGRGLVGEDTRRPFISGITADRAARMPLL